MLFILELMKMVQRSHYFTSLLLVTSPDSPMTKNRGEVESNAAIGIGSDPAIQIGQKIIAVKV